MTAPKELPAPPPVAATDLIRWRAYLKLSQRAAAKALGCSPTALGNWETGATDVPPYIGLAMTTLTQKYAPRRVGPASRAA